MEVSLYRALSREGAVGSLLHHKCVVKMSLMMFQVPYAGSELIFIHKSPVFWILIE